MLSYLHSELLFITSRYLGWNDIFFTMKHINKRIQYEVENNKKLIRRKSLVYMRILQQQLHFRKSFERPDILSHYNPRKNDFVDFFEHLLNQIDVSSLSNNQKKKLVKIIKQFDYYNQ